MIGGLGSFFTGLTGLFTGPKSPGSPQAGVGSVGEVAQESATLSAFRQDVIRRNMMKKSSTIGDFIEKMNNPQLDTPEEMKVKKKQHFVEVATNTVKQVQDQAAIQTAAQTAAGPANNDGGYGVHKVRLRGKGTIGNLMKQRYG